MVRKHVVFNKDNIIKQVTHIGVDDEYIMLELFGTDVGGSLFFTPSLNNIKYDTEKMNVVNRMNVPCYISKNANPMNLKMNFSASTGLYAIEILYEQSSSLHAEWGDSTNDKRFDSSVDLLGSYVLYSLDNSGGGNVKVIDEESDDLPESVKKQMQEIQNTAKNIVIDEDKSIKFDGENNVLKRKVIYEEISGGEYTLELNVPSNCYFQGLFLRKLNRYWATNTEEAGTNIYMKPVQITDSEMIKPREAKITLAYDDILDSKDNPNSLSIIYNDECNIYIRDNEGKICQFFGGRVKNISKQDTSVELSCKDRLADTLDTYIMDYLTIQGGTKQQTEYNPRNFKRYGELLKYLCDITEETLHTNITDNYGIANEKNNDGLNITFGKKKKVKNITVNNGKFEVHDNSIVLKNNDDGTKKQVFKIYSPKTRKDLSKYWNNYSEKDLNMHIKIGMGNPKTTQQIKNTEDVSIGDETAGSVKWTKCGVSPDKKYVMGIGQKSAGKTNNKYRTGYWRSVFVNECPHCKKKGTLRWDSARNDTKCIFTQNWNGSKKNWDGGIPETEITCTYCDSDYDSVGGWEKTGSNPKRLKSVRIGFKSSKEEQDLLHKGKLKAPIKSNIHVSADEIFTAVKNSVRGYKYRRNTGSTASYLEKHGVGDCHAWSDKIKKELARYKVNSKIVEYKTNESDHHRSVLYLNSKGKYVDFPYREYGFPKETYNTSKSKTARKVDSYTQGGRISQAVVGSADISKTETNTITVTKGYDVSNPFKAYLDIIFSIDGTLTKHAYMEFTLPSSSKYEIGKFKPVFVNNSIKEFTFKGIITHIKEAFHIPSGTIIYLHGINFITPKIVTKNEDENKQESTWYTNDKNTKDHSSCKMILYSVSFDCRNDPDPYEYESCGKTVNDVLNTIIQEGNLLVDMTYSQHRCDDVINFRVNNNLQPVFAASDKANIIKWDNVNYNSENNLYNISRCVFKNNVTQKYNYIEKKDIESILMYGGRTSLEKLDDESNSLSEAYWTVQHDSTYNPSEICDYSITVMGCFDGRLEDLIEVDSENDRLDDIRSLKSISITYDPKTRPSVRTVIGLNDKDSDLNVRDIIRSVKEESLQKDTSFKGSAEPIRKDDEYIWDD